MLSFPNMVHLLPHEFSRLGAGRFAFPSILAGSIECLLFGHVYLLGRAMQFFFRIRVDGLEHVSVTVINSCGKLI
jgi:hypothetical protein